jgi:hypothetical protein
MYRMLHDVKNGEVRRCRALCDHWEWRKRLCFALRGDYKYGK